MNDYTKKQLAIISNITNYDNEKDLNEGINNIQNMIIKNGNSWYNIDKILIINIAKNKRNIVGQKVWNNVKSNFGKLLKIIKYISKKEKLIDKILNKNNNGVLYKYSFLTNYSSLKKINIFPKYKVKKIATGGNHMLILTNNNLVYTYGSNTFGQLGYKSNFNLPMIDRSYTFKCLNDIPNKFKIVDISCGHAFSFLISENGNVLGFGCCEDGRLGINNDYYTKKIYKPTLLNFKYPIKKIQCGSTFSCFLSFDNLLYSCGNAPYHGLNILQNVYTPTNIKFFNNKDVLDLSIHCSGYHTLVLTKNNNVYSFGHNRCFQLGYDITDNDIDINYHHEIEENIKLSKYIYIPYPKQIDFLIDKRVIKVSAGWGHSLILLFDGTVITCGRNSNGQCGVTKNNSITNSNNIVVSKINNLNNFSNSKDLLASNNNTVLKINDHHLKIVGSSSNDNHENNNFNIYSELNIQDFTIYHNIYEDTNILYTIEN